VADPGFFLSRIRIRIKKFFPDPFLDFLPIPDPGVKKAPATG
jgi:hypothetical protein